MSTDANSGIARNLYMIRGEDDELVNWFEEELRAVDWAEERGGGPMGDLTVELETVEACKGCDDFRSPLEDGQCFFCHDAKSGAVDRFDQVFRDVAEEYNFAIAFWSYDKVYNRYDGDGLNGEFPDDIDGGFDGD